MGGRLGYSSGRVKLACLFLLAGLGSTSTVQAECLTLIKGPVVYDVSGCKLIAPERDFDFSKARYKWVADLDAGSRKKFLDTYRGLYLKGTVVKSDAKQTGVGVEDGALEGDTVYFFMPPSQNACANVVGKRLSGNVSEVCCDGGGNAPCLLGSPYLFLGVKAIGDVGSGAGDDVRTKAKTSAAVKAGNQAFAKRTWKEAAIQFEKALARGEMDVESLYRLGFSYRELDNCPRAIRPLKEIYEKQIKGKIWADEEPTARKATFLLARCYSKMNDPAMATLILNGYLLEAKKFRQEIRDAQKHKDFGWIHTSKEYRDWKAAAQKEK